MEVGVLNILRLVGNIYTMKIKYDVCPSCNRQYIKNIIPQYCINGFHACRDCKIENGRIIIKCIDCLLREEQYEPKV